MNDKIKTMWDKICAGATAAGEFASKTAESAGEKAKDVYNASKINLKIFDLKTDIDVVYKELGKLIYKAHKGEGGSAEEIDDCLAVIDEKLEQIETLRAELENEASAKVCVDCGKENEPQSAFCSACGAKLED